MVSPVSPMLLIYARIRSRSDRLMVRFWTLFRITPVQAMMPLAGAPGTGIASVKIDRSQRG